MSSLNLSAADKTVIAEVVQQGRDDVDARLDKAQTLADEIKARRILAGTLGVPQPVADDEERAS